MKGLEQFDVIVIHSMTVTHYDIKNYKGLFSAEVYGLINQHGKDFKKRFSPQYEVESYIVYINEGFHFSGDNCNPKWLFRSILGQHLKFYTEISFMAGDNEALCIYLKKMSSEPIDMNPIKRYPFHMKMKGLRCICGVRVEELLRNRKKMLCPACHQCFQ